MVAAKYLDENEDQLGKFVRYEWERFVYYKGRCVWDSSGTDGILGVMMNYKEMHKEIEGNFCKYNFYFYAADCGACTEEERRIVYYSYLDRTTKSDQDSAILKILYLWLQFWLYTPFILFFNLIGEFGFTEQ